jgi:hypothetical protein
MSQSNSPVAVRLSTRLAAAVVAVLVVLGAGALTDAARADVVVGGVQFHTSVDCGGSTMLTHTDSWAANGYERIGVYSYTTGRFTQETRWHQASVWNFARPAEFSFYPGRYAVYVYYAQLTSSGWVYSGEWMTQYTQHSGLSQWFSSTCYMG